MATWKVLLLVILPALVSCAPLELTESNFQDTIDSDKAVFVKFYAPWCGHCKKLAPTWEDLSAQYAGTNVLIAKVDCTSETKTCADHSVKGYPTLKLFDAGNIWDHRGARDLKTLTEFVKSHVDNHIEETTKPGPKVLTDASFNEFITSTPGLLFVKFYAPWCGHCQRLAPVWDQLNEQFTDNPEVHILKVDCTKETVTCQEQEVKGYPTLLLFVNGVVAERYSGGRDLDSLVTFLTTNKAQREVEGVRELDADGFNNALNENTVMFVKFFAPWCGHCKRLAPIWDQLAEAVHSSSSVTIAKVDCTVEKALCSEQSVHGYPTLVLFNGGQRKPYNKARDLESLLSFVQENT